MKKAISIILATATIILSLAGCASSDSNKELNAYKASMEEFFTTLEDIDAEINAIDPESNDAMELLYESFAKLEEAYYNMSQLTVPTEGAPETFVYIESLADSAYDYMLQASDYMHDAYSESSYNESILEAALECYKRASKRVLYIIDLLHGNIPADEAISISAS